MKLRTLALGAMTTWLLSAAWPAAAETTGWAGRCSCGAGETAAPSSRQDEALREKLQADLGHYLAAHGTTEHVSAISLSVSFARRGTLNLSTGTTEYGGKTPVPPRSLWQIGSNTKSFTAALILKLEADHVLSINDTLGRWLPQYPAWRAITIRQLLNMTSGIPTYDAQPAFLAAYAAAPASYFSPTRLVGYAAGLPLQTGWNYTNTGYLLAQMVIEKATGESYRVLLTKRLFAPLGLHDMVYRSNLTPSAVTARMPAGYLFDRSIPQFAPLFDADMRPLSLSWAQAAGGIVASTEALAKWDRALYTGCVLAPAQQKELESLVSERDGLPIPRTSPSVPIGFGLGVQQQNSALLGLIWDYEGESFGYRMLHIYLTGSRTVIAIGLNSGVLGDADQIGSLGLTIYQTLRDAGRL